MNLFEKYLKQFQENRVLFIAVLFLAAFLFRSPAMFIDYYDVDELAVIVQTKEYMAGDLPGEDFSISKKELFHIPFRISYALSPEYGWVIASFFVIIIVFFTSLFIYLTGRRVFSENAGIAAAFLYAVLISSFNRHFMAINGEVVFNLPVAASLYFYVLFLQARGRSGPVYLSAALVSGLISFAIKFQGIIPLIVIPFHLFIYIPYYEKRLTLKYFSRVLTLIVSVFFIFMADYFITGIFAPEIVLILQGKLYYAAGHGFDSLIYPGKFFHRNLFLFFWHFIVWGPVFVYLYRLALQRFRPDTLPETAVVLFMAAYYALIYAGGQRIYFHYFMAVYPALCVISAGALIHLKHNRGIDIIKRYAVTLIMVPALFFLSWNYKDVVIKHFSPRAYYSEGKLLFWTRAVLVGTYDDYLLPELGYVKAVERIKELTDPGDPVFVWGNGPYLYYFTDRRMGGNTLWPRGAIDRIIDGYEEGTPGAVERARSIERGFIRDMEYKQPVLFADTSENGLASFDIPLTPLIKKYVEKNYIYVETVDNIKLYLRKDNK